MAPRARVLFSPQARDAVLRGVNLLADTLKLTLGPVGRTVAYDPNVADRPPEILTDGATIARRIIGVPDRYTNMGLLLARNLAWHVGQTVGDGSSTAVVLLQALLQEANRYITAGVNPVWVRSGMERGLGWTLEALRNMAQPIEGEKALAGLALAATGDPELSKVVGEALDMVGPDGTIEIKEYLAPYLEREYVEGGRWRGEYFSRLFATDKAGVVAELENPLIVVSDVWASDASDIIPVLEAATTMRAKSLLVIAGGIKGDALATMILNKRNGNLPCVGVKAPEIGAQRHQMLRDIALLTGAHFFDSQVEGTLRDIKPADFGSARRAWADPEHYAIIGAGGDPSAIRQHMRTLRSQLRGSELGSEEREGLAARLGKLVGGVCVLKIGAIGERELEARKQMALDAIASARAAMEEGVVPGGGAAYVHCAGELSTRDEVTDPEERFGLLALGNALCAPAAAIARNSGYSPSSVLARLREGPAGHGFDARTGKIVSMWEAGILDPVQVLRVALQMAVSAASMALTTEALVLTRASDSEPFGEIGSDTLEP